MRQTESEHIGRASWRRQTAVLNNSERDAAKTNGESQVKQVIINLHADNKAVQSKMTSTALCLGLPIDRLLQEHRL